MEYLQTFAHFSQGIAFITFLIEGLFFAHYLRRTHPTLPNSLQSGILNTPIKKQLHAIQWLWKREYTEFGDPALTKRADTHRNLGLTCLTIIILSQVLIAIA